MIFDMIVIDVVVDSVGMLSSQELYLYLCRYQYDHVP